MDTQTMVALLNGVMKLAPGVIQIFQTREHDGQIEFRGLIEKKDFNAIMEQMKAEGDAEIREALARLEGG